MSLSFLTPAFLLGALVAAVPIFLHLLRRERVPLVRFSDVRFLRGANIEQSRRRRLYDLLLLALRVVVVVLLSFAFAHPFCSQTVQPDGSATVILLDTSFSMSAPGQQVEARTLARAAIDAAPDDHQIGVVAFDDVARVVADLGNSRSFARAAVDTLSSRPRGTRFSEGLGAASALLGSREGRLIVVTDLQAVGWDIGSGAVSPQVEVELRPVAPPVSNLAVVGLEVEPDSTRIVLLQTGPSSGETTVSLAVDGEVIHERSIRPEPGRSSIQFPPLLPAQGVAMASVVDPVGYPADDRRFRLLDPPPALPVLILVDSSQSRESFYLERALAPGSNKGPFTVSAVNPTALSVRPEILEGIGAVVLVETIGLDRRGRDLLAGFVRGGGGLFAIAGPSFDGNLVSDLLGRDVGFDLDAPQIHLDPITLVLSDLRHPIIQGLGSLASRLGETRFTRTVAADTETGTVIARFSDQSPALIEYAVGSGRVLILGSDLSASWNDWPRRRTFVPFLHETVSYVAAQRLLPQEFVIGDAPDGLSGKSGAFTLDGRPGQIILNVDSVESDPTVISQERFLASVDRLAQAAERRAAQLVGEQELVQRLWRYLLMLVALFLLVEGWLGRRAV